MQPITPTTPITKSDMRFLFIGISRRGSQEGIEKAGFPLSREKRLNFFNG